MEINDRINSFKEDTHEKTIQMGDWDHVGPGFGDCSAAHPAGDGAGAAPRAAATTPLPPAGSPGGRGTGTTGTGNLTSPFTTTRGTDASGATRSSSGTTRSSSGTTRGSSGTTRGGFSTGGGGKASDGGE